MTQSLANPWPPRPDARYRNVRRFTWIDPYDSYSRLIFGLPILLIGTSQLAGADEPSPVTAIDILLEPDDTMVRHAEAANKRLLKEFPKGFALDKTHHPHISCLQRYVKTTDLDKVYDAVGKVLAKEKPTSWKLKAYKYYYIPWKISAWPGSWLSRPTISSDTRRS